MAKHIWRFFRAGGFDQVRIETGEDLVFLDELDRKLWVALSLPTAGIEFDSETLALIDSDGDGHVRDGEIIGAVKWAAIRLKDAEWLAKGKDALPLSAIGDEKIVAAARHILKTLGREKQDEIALSDCIEMNGLFAQLPFNGDGIVPLEAAGSDSQRRVMQEILDCTGASGISRENADAFFAEIESYSAWASLAGPEILVLGENTEGAARAWLALKEKVEDYFRRCRIAAYDARAALLINRSEEDLARLASLDLARADEEISAFPIASAEAGKPLPLIRGLNPLWAGAVARFREQAVLPLLGDREKLTEEEWQSISSKLQPFEAWQLEKPATAVERHGEARILQIASGNEKAGIDGLIEQDLKLEPEMKAIAEVEQLLRYCRDLYLLANNFASFRDFYTRRDKAIFQAGTLFLDGRSCELCVEVAGDVGRHAALATLSRICLVYCECRRGEQKRTIAAAFTAGDSDQLMTGRNGVFYDRKGQDWDATIVRIVDHPISIRQAFMSPYKTIGRMVGEQIQKIAASKTMAMQQSATRAVLESGKADSKAQQAFDVGKFAGIFAAIGLAVGAIGTALASVVTGLLGLKFWQVPFALFFLMMAVSGPSMLIAWLKLRQRNLGPILDANGWAINSRAKINIPFGSSLTGLAKLPEGAERALTDPYAEKKRAWIGYAIVAMIVLLILLVRVVMR